MENWGEGLIRGYEGGTRPVSSLPLEAPHRDWRGNFLFSEFLIIGTGPVVQVYRIVRTRANARRSGICDAICRRVTGIWSGLMKTWRRGAARRRNRFDGYDSNSECIECTEGYQSECHVVQPCRAATWSARATQGSVANPCSAKLNIFEIHNHLKNRQK